MEPATVTNPTWDRTKAELRKLFPGDVYEMWFAPLRCRDEAEERLVIEAPNDFAAIWLKDNYADLLHEQVSLAAGREMAVLVEVAATTDNGTGEGPGAAESMDRLGVAGHEVLGGAGRGGRHGAPRGERRTQKLALNPRYNFDNFIVGPSNQLAHAASLAVAQTPGKAYNPLFLYGDTGLGKTHLMHAIAQAAVQRHEDLNIVYLSCEKFTNEFMRAIQDNTLPKFRKTYRNIDVLLIDDIHFLAGKERTQEEFFHTFNELFESERQICLCSDRPASEIAKLENRLVSRFQWGMVTDIQSPDLETRTAILRKKVKAHSFRLHDDIIGFLAERITRNVRRLEGALIKVATYASLVKRPLDIPTVENLIHDILQEEVQNQITVERIQRKVVEFFDLRMADMVSKRRPNNIAFPRQIAMYLSRVLTNLPLKEIGDAFGGRDHGTVIHACKTVENIMEQDETVRRNVEYLTNKIRSGS